MTAVKTAKLICVVVSLVPALALADESASDAFARGQTAMKAGRVHEACQAFEASEKLDPKVDTELALAGCDEQDGKPIAAARLYERLAVQDPNQVRRSTWAAKAKKLEENAPRVRLAITPQVAGTTVWIDGMDAGAVTGEVPVDVGPHDITAKAPGGYEGHASTALEKDRQVVDVAIAMQQSAAAQPPTTPPVEPQTPPATGTPPATATPPATGTATASEQMMPPATAEGGGGHDKRNGAIIGGAGAVVLVTSIVLFAESSSKFSDEHDLCPNHTCASASDAATANDDRDSARNLRGAGYVTGIIGLAALGVGGYLFFSAKDESSGPRMSLNVDRNSAGLSFSGHF